MSADVRPDIEAVFDYYGKRILRSYGEWSKCECPLLDHEDRNPSASVNTETGKWQCFSCDGHGDAYDIIERNEGLVGFLAARQWAEEYLAASCRPVRAERGSRSGLSVRPAARKGSRTFRPPWSGL